MTKKNIIFVPGKNPKPEPAQHKKLLWRSMLEGIRRSEPELVSDISPHIDCFKLIAWNYLYYHQTKDVSRDLPWIDALINKHGPTAEDIEDTKTWQRKLAKFYFSAGDIFPFVIPLLPKVIRQIEIETRRYFRNENDIACEIRELLKQELRPMLSANENILLIGHSLGSVIAYDTLWELSHLEQLPGKVDLFLTLGSPLGMNYVQRRLMGYDQKGKQQYPHNIRHWVNISSVGDITALDREFRDDFSHMLEFGIIESIEDHSEAIYNFFRNEAGLNVHRSYGYLVNPAVGYIIADWWRETANSARE
jgi:hypothetical protein